MSKAFAYVFNTPSKDARIARVLSGRPVSEETELLTLTSFGTSTQQWIRVVNAKLFFASHNLASSQHTVSMAVLNMFFARLLLHISSLRQLSANSLIMKRIHDW